MIIRRVIPTLSIPTLSVPTLSIPTSSIPIWSTSHFVNSHLVNVDKAGIDKVGIDEVGRYLSEEYSVPRGVKQGSVLLYTSTVSVSYGSPLLKQPHCSMLGGGGGGGEFSMWITLELWRPVKPACRHS